MQNLTDAINAEARGYTAKLDRSFCSTDRKGGRLITKKGKGRRGFRIVVRGPDGAVAFDYDTSWTYASVIAAVEQARRAGVLAPLRLRK